MSDKKNNKEIMDVFGDEGGATPSPDKGPKTQQLPIPEVIPVSDSESDAKSKKKKKKKKAKKKMPNDEESASRTSSKKKRTSKKQSPFSEITPAVDHEIDMSSKKKKKNFSDEDGTARRSSESSEKKKQKQKQKKSSRDEDSNTPTTPKKNKSNLQLHGSDNESASKKKRMVQFEIDGTVQEHSLKYIFSANSQDSLVAKKKKRKKKETFKGTRDTSMGTLPTISNHSSGHMSLSSSMETFKTPSSYGKSPSYMRGHHDHDDYIENPYDKYMNEKGYYENDPAADGYDDDDEFRIRYKKTTLDLADTSIINNRRCLIVAGIFFVISTLTISLILSSKMALWMGNDRRLLFSRPRQDLRGG